MSTLADKIKLTDQQIRERMQQRFAVLSKLSIDAAQGHLRGLVVYGAPGVGKSFEVTEALKSVGALDTTIIQKGHVSTSGLYGLLYNNRQANKTIVFDDSDGVLSNEDSLALLKAALDTTSKRIIQWATSGRSDGLPPSFQFDASIIFITNTNFIKVSKSNSKIAPHIEAILSRCLYLDLLIDTLRERVLRLNFVMHDLGMLARELSQGDDAINEFEIDFIVDELSDWINANAGEFLELSLRKVIHLASLRKLHTDWQEIAEMTILREAR